MKNSSLLKAIYIRNFKVFRAETKIEFHSSTYLVGPNNSGKSTVLLAIRYFFDDALYEERNFLNKSEVISRTTGARKSEITIVFNLMNLNNSGLRAKFDRSRKEIEVKKIAHLSESGVLRISYEVDGKQYGLSNLPEHIRALVNGIKINYLHPQQGEVLLHEAQLKLRRRLLDNWGRRKTMTKAMQALENEWKSFRELAKSYLSESLNDNVKRIWPDSEVSISLPQDVKTILEISDISFSSRKSNPMVNLLSQGSGAQALILYFTHYILDSDKAISRSRGAEHHPIWLIEEPESFLHADLISKIADQFNSEDWLSNIQFVISTHSSILLAKSHVREGAVMWHSMRDGIVKKSKSSEKGLMKRLKNWECF